VLVTVYLAIVLPTLVIFFVLWGLRHSRRRLRHSQPASSATSSEGFQFTIRQLFVVTAIAAVVLAVGRTLGRFRVTGDGSQEAFFFAVTGPYFILVELATTWAALGIGRPLPRLLIVLPTAFIVGAIPPFYLKGQMHVDWEDYSSWSMFVGIEATIIAASLLVARSCGWRLVRAKNGLPLDQPTPYNEPLADRIRRSLAGRLEEREFSLGGIRFLLNGNMCVGVWKNSLVARIGPEQGELALKQKHITEFNMTGQPIRGVVLVAPEGVEHDDRLNDWIRRAEEFVVALPAK